MKTKQRYGLFHSVVTLYLYQTFKFIPIRFVNLFIRVFFCFFEPIRIPEYKTFVGNFIEKIEVGKYIVNITLKTGLGIYPELDTTLDVRRQEIYERKNH